MRFLNGRLIFSATDLSHFLACPHLTLLNRRTALGGPKPPQYPEDPGLEVLRQRGQEHERKYLERLKDGGARTIADLSSQSWGSDDLSQRAAATIDAMKSGADIIYQGFLFDGEWLGKPDFLRRVETPGAFGGWSYEVIDTKLAREAKGGALLQVLLYSDLLEGVQGRPPARVHLALGGPDAPVESFRVDDYGAYFRSIRRQFINHVTGAPDEPPVAVDPVDHCEICDWDPICTRERREVDHLSFVAGISRRERRALAEEGITTLEALGDLDTSSISKLDGVSSTSLTRIREQARIQLEARRQSKRLHELLDPVEAEKGLAMLPAPSRGDLFFDIEGDPYAFDLGIEYLFGVVDMDGAYTGSWALDRAGEKKTFEEFMDFVSRRLEEYPNLHVYHYAAYEPAALKRLAGRYDSRVEDLDRLLRGRVFVDLYRVVRQGLRASVESYSIKKLEPFYGFERQVPMRAANLALSTFEAWLQLGGSGKEGSEILSAIEGYNKDDCVSTSRLRDWLESLRAELEKSGREIARPAPASPEPSEELSDRQREIRELMDRLTAGIPDEENERTSEQQARWTLAHLLEYHRREDKSMWWRYFDWCGMTDDELIEDRTALGGMEYAGIAGTEKKSVIHRYTFPPQLHGIAPYTKRPPKDPRTQKSAGTVIAVDETARTIDLKRASYSTVPHPTALFPDEYVPADDQKANLLRIGHAVAENGFDRSGAHAAAFDLLLIALPRVGQKHGASLQADGEEHVENAIRLVCRLDRSVLPIQGPPGAGKTYTGARMILALLDQRKKVGVTGTSHKVISNLLKEVCDAAEKTGQKVNGIQKADDEDWCGASDIRATEDNNEVVHALRNGDVLLAAGTSWLFSRQDMADSLDVLFIDEAGQYSLADALAVSPAAKSLVLLGDPRQLQRPQQGLHPPGCDASALDHLLGGAITLPPDRGLFLDRTWRLHPDICRFTSELYYENRLRPRPGLEKQRIGGVDNRVGGSGLRWFTVNHDGNQNESPEEVTTIQSLIAGLLQGEPTWTDAQGQDRILTLDDILVVAPYNAQVAAIREALPPGALVGTVDKFQGQEAPVVIYSMAASSAEDAPRGMNFLYEPNRLNVATSRARCLVILVATGRIFLPSCRTPEQMRLANGICRYGEMATKVAVGQVDDSRGRPGK